MVDVHHIKDPVVIFVHQGKVILIAHLLPRCAEGDIKKAHVLHLLVPQLQVGDLGLAQQLEQLPEG